jgi:hypothetical protein
MLNLTLEVKDLWHGEVSVRLQIYIFIPVALRTVLFYKALALLTDIRVL